MHLLLIEMDFDSYGIPCDTCQYINRATVRGDVDHMPFHGATTSGSISLKGMKGMPLESDTAFFDHEDSVGKTTYLGSVV
jgi:hypothetical protein